jgi:MYXO-CTERM domain-containing protein
VPGRAGSGARPHTWPVRAGALALAAAALLFFLARRHHSRPSLGSR